MVNGKGTIPKIKGSISMILIEAANVYNILRRHADSNRLIVVKSIKQDLKYGGYLYFEPVRSMSYTRY